MINLLPLEDKRQLAAARTNTLLLRYSVLLAIVIVLLVLETAGMYFVLDAGTAQNKATIAENQQKTAAYADTKREADALTANLATAKYILGRQVPYTDLILTIANSLPQGSTLDTLALDPATFDTPTSLTVKITSYGKSIEVKSALQNAKLKGTTPVFSSVSFQSVAANNDTNTPYGFTATYHVTYSKAVLAQ